MSTRSRPQARAGFTIIEAVVAVTIIGLTSVAALAAFGEQLRAMERAKASLEIDALLEETMSTTRVLSADILQSLPDSLKNGTFPAPFETFRWERQVGIVLGTPALFEATVVVRRITGVDRDGSSRPDLARSQTTRLYRHAALTAPPR